MRRIILALKKLEDWAIEEKPKGTEKPTELAKDKEKTEIHSVWEYLSIKENTQATHLVSTIGFEEWVEMPEIKRRIIELFGMEYKNERSLYPYIKTLVDCGLFESTDIGGKRKWKKKALLLKLKQEEDKKEKETATKKAENSTNKVN